MTLSATVVVCTFDRPDILDRCLTAIKAVDYPSYDVLVVDNNDVADAARAIAEKHAVRYVHEPVAGVNRARNCGLREATGDVAAFLDDDATPDGRWLANLMRHFDDDAVAAVTGRIIAGTPSEPRTDLVADLAGFDGGTERKRVDRTMPDWFERTNFGGVGAGGNMAFRRQAVGTWGGFDERIGFGTSMRGFGEHNAFYRVVEHGFAVVYEPDAFVHHPPAPDLDSARMRQVRSVTTAVAYVLLLFTEAPQHRVRLLRYLAGGARQKVRPWRSTDTRPLRLPRTTQLRAAMRGPLLYWQWRRDQKQRR